MRDHKIQKYLRTRAITTPWQLAGNSRTNFDAVIVIPALAEFNCLPKTLESLRQNPAESLSRALIVVVINHRSAASISEKTDNLQTLDWLNSNPCPDLNLGWVDATGPGLELPAKDGVGLARKIGFDLALARLDWSGDPLLISLDADCLVDENYLAAIFAHFRGDSCLGAYLPFRHQQADSAAQESAIRRYELYLRSTLFGLDWAGSPYAFTSIGSALACRAAGYVAAGGMKRRLAGEDFYFLQQLAKIGKVSPLFGTVVHPSPRCSLRVPFGTGRAVQSEVEEGRSVYAFASSTSFRVLKDWHSLLSGYLDSSGAEILHAAADLSPPLAQFLAELDFCSAWQRVQQNTPRANLMSAWHNWFDGLRTRQLLSRLETNSEVVNFESQVAELLEAGGYPGYRKWSGQQQLLEQLQGVVAGSPRED